MLTLRLRKIIGEIIHPDQTCSIPGRTIQDNVHLIRNVVEYTNDKNMTAAIISLDQSKAFDRVSHKYLFNVLRNFGFKSHFITYLLYLCLFARSEHRPSTKERHCFLSVAIFSISFQVYPISFVSFSVPLCQVFRGLPLLLFPGGFHVMA